MVFIMRFNFLKIILKVRYEVLWGFLIGLLGGCWVFLFLIFFWDWNQPGVWYWSVERSVCLTLTRIPSTLGILWIQILRRAKSYCNGSTLETFQSSTWFPITVLCCATWCLETSTTAQERFPPILNACNFRTVEEGTWMSGRVCDFLSWEGVGVRVDYRFLYTCTLYWSVSHQVDFHDFSHWESTKAIVSLALTAAPITLPRQGTWNSLCWAETQWQRVAHCPGGSARKEPQADCGWWCCWG